MFISAYGSFQLVDMGNVAYVSDIRAAQWFLVSVNLFFVS
jgi:hypothetical protein